MQTYDLLTCRECGTEETCEHFKKAGKDKNGNQKYRNICKPCAAEKERKRYANPEKRARIFEQLYKSQRKRRADPEKRARMKEQSRKCQRKRRADPEQRARMNARNVAYAKTAKGKATRNKWHKERYENDPGYRIDCSLSACLISTLKAQHASKNTRHDERYGCTIAYLVKHLEKQFTPEMNWDNYGKGKYWEIDHIRPRSLFDVTKRNDQLEINHFTNLRPLPITENQAKSNKWSVEQENDYQIKWRIRRYQRDKIKFF